MMNKILFFLVVFPGKKVLSHAILRILSDFAAEDGHTGDECSKLKLFIKEKTLKPR